MVLKYPIGMQGLPLDEKFGFNGPVGGFLQQHQVNLITSLIHPDERRFLQSLSDSDPEVQATAEYIHSLPDLAAEEWERQTKDFGRFIGEEPSESDAE